MSAFLHASLKEQPLLLSISWDPSSAPKINKCLCTVLSKNTKEKEEKGFLRREVKHATPLGYSPGSLEMEQCVFSCITPSGYCPGMLAVEQHKNQNLYFENLQLVSLTSLPGFETLKSKLNF